MNPNPAYGTEGICMRIVCHHRTFYCFLMLSALLCTPVLLLAAAPQSDSQQLPRVSLGEIKGTPGSNVMMPLSLTPDPKLPLRSLVVDIVFVSKSLVFQKASRGLAAELVEADIQAVLAKEESDEKGLKHVTLRVTASLPEPPSTPTRSSSRTAC